MRLFDAKPAPNPRRVRIFLAEKGVAVGSGEDVQGPDAVTLVPVDISAGEQRDEAALARNPLGQIPVLELEDGTCIAESIAICRYFEERFPAPPLMGAGAVGRAQVEMWNRRIELGLLAPTGTAWRNGDIVARAAPGRFRQIPEAREDAEATARRFHRRLDAWLGETPFVAGESFSIADITALCTLDFGSRLVNLAPDPGLEHLARWHAVVSARPSAGA
ncbi:MAG: glutathione S-transferase family protein [Pseudomonadales bacterium]|jgi:glutathione S-transferase|nr:glutathione S-transferase family protein [Pseudomonadales bacterium]